MSGVEKLKEIERFTATNFAQESNDPGRWRSDALRRSRIATAGKPFCALPRFEPDKIGLAQLKFSRVFDEEDALVIGNEAVRAIRQASSFPCPFRR